MSLGEHLAELQRCLWWAIIWLFLGTIVGFYLGGPVVHKVQEPLNKALEEYYEERSLKGIKERSGELENFGYSTKEIARIAKKERLVPEVSYVYRDQFEKFLHDGIDQTVSEPLSAEKPPVSKLDSIDNLNHYERSEPEKKETAQSDVPKTQGDPATELFPFITYKKIGDVSKTRASALGVHESFTIFIKAALVVGFILGSPGIFFSIWSFVASGLYFHEKKYIYYFMPVSIGLFLGGAAFAFYCVIKYVIKFLFAFNAWMDIDPDTRISEWMSFVLLLPVGFGVSFQLPLVMFVLERVGILTTEMMLSKWRVAVLIIFVISMFLTPADPQSLVLMAVPLCALYFLGIGICYIFPKKKSEFNE